MSFSSQKNNTKRITITTYHTHIHHNIFQLKLFEVIRIFIILDFVYTKKNFFAYLFQTKKCSFLENLIITDANTCMLSFVPTKNFHSNNLKEIRIFSKKKLNTKKTHSILLFQCPKIKWRLYLVNFFIQIRFIAQW